MGKRKGDKAKMYLLGCTIAFLSPASIMSYEWENCLGRLIGERKELKLPSCFSFLTQIISVGARMVVVDGAGNKQKQCNVSCLWVRMSENSLRSLEAWIGGWRCYTGHCLERRWLGHSKGTFLLPWNPDLNRWCLSKRPFPHGKNKPSL